MAYPARLLDPGEEVVVDVRAHGWRLAPPMAAVVAVLAGGVATMAAHLGRAVRVLDAAAGVVLLAALCWLVVRYLRWATSSFVVTTERAVWRRGVVIRRQTDIPLGMVRDVQVRQSLGQRMLRAGDLVVDSGGAAEVARWLPAPGALRRELWRQVEVGRRGPPVSVALELDRLDALWRRGSLSAGELEAQRARLLRR